MSKWKKIILIALNTALVVSGIIFYNYRNSTKGLVMPLILTDGHPGMTREEVARHMVDRAHLYVNYISKCNRFPDNIEDMYHERFFEVEGCKPFAMRSFNTFIDTKDNVRPWIDPWGRPYQIRYDRERRKLQVRSQGSSLSLTSDDIEAETTWGTARAYFDIEIENCDRGEGCIFDRGWH